MINAWSRLTYFSLSVIDSLRLILRFFDLEEGGDIHNNVLEGIAQHATETRTFKSTHMANVAICHTDTTSRQTHQTPTTSDL